MIEAHGFDVDRFSAACIDDDASETLARLAKRDIDWLVVDAYQLDRRWEERISAVSRRMLVIDDLADRPHHCDVLVDPSRADGAAYRDLVAKNTNLLAGPRFALMRGEFAAARPAAERRLSSTGASHVLVFF